jgi:hypothetical protein
MLGATSASARAVCSSAHTAVVMTTNNKDGFWETCDACDCHDTHNMATMLFACLRQNHFPSPIIIIIIIIVIIIIINCIVFILRMSFRFRICLWVVK